MGASREPWVPMGAGVQVWRVGADHGIPRSGGKPGAIQPDEPGAWTLKAAAASLERLAALVPAARDLGFSVWWDWGAGHPEAPLGGQARWREEPPPVWSDDAAWGQGLILTGPGGRLDELAARWERQDPESAAALRRGLEGGRSRPEAFRACGRWHGLNRPPYLLGILNVTRDSFYAGARHFGLDAALRRGEAIAREGGDWIEVGGESARGGTPLPAEVEAERVAPVVAALRSRLELPIAVDTYKPLVARAAVEAGATLINDITGGADPEMFRVARETGAALVLMHLSQRPKSEYQDPGYPSTVDAVRWTLGERLLQAEAAGVPREQLLVDPGLNFGKHPRRDLAIMRSLREFLALGRPVYLATSRKDYLRDLLGLPPEELLEPTEAAVAYAILQGVQLFRIHDVAAMARVRATVWAIREAAAAARAG